MIPAGVKAVELIVRHQRQHGQRVVQTAIRMGEDPDDSLQLKPPATRASSYTNLLSS